MNITYKLFLLLIITYIPVTSHAHEADISGSWYETKNFPSSSILKFIRNNGVWRGIYTQVSAPQLKWGYTVNETVIKGKFEKEHFVGKVLIKYSKKAKAYCDNTEDKWEDIKMELLDTDKLYGSWHQHIIDYKGDCKIKDAGWQTYGLERLKQ